MPNPKQIEKEKIELTREFARENLEKLEIVKQVREKLKRSRKNRTCMRNSKIKTRNTKKLT